MYIVEDLDKQRIQEMSDLLADPKNLNIFLRSKSFEGQTDKEEYWYKTKYARESFSDELKDKMINPKPIIKSKKLDLPPANNLIPKDFGILEENKELSARPVLI